MCVIFIHVSWQKCSSLAPDWLAAVPIRCHVRRSLLTNTNFNMDFFLVIHAPGFPFQRLWPAVDMMLKEVLMYAYTLEVRDAWRAIFDFLVERMEIGMNLEYESRTLANANGASVEGANGKLPSGQKDGPSTSGNTVGNGKGKWNIISAGQVFWITIMFVTRLQLNCWEFDDWVVILSSCVM